MINGFVNSTLEPTISIIVQDANGHQLSVEVVVDTGFNGYLTLPASVVASLGLPWQTKLSGGLADGSSVVFDIFDAVVIWNGVARLIDVQATKTTALLGTEILRDHSLLVHVRPGGTVQVATLP